MFVELMMCSVEGLLLRQIQAIRPPSYVRPFMVTFSDVFELSSARQTNGKDRNRDPPDRLTQSVYRKRNVKRSVTVDRFVACTEC